MKHKNPMKKDSLYFECLAQDDIHTAVQMAISGEKIVIQTPTITLFFGVQKALSDKNIPFISENTPNREFRVKPRINI